MPNRSRLARLFRSAATVLGGVALVAFRARGIRYLGPVSILALLGGPFLLGELVVRIAERGPRKAWLELAVEALVLAGILAFLGLLHAAG